MQCNLLQNTLREREEIWELAKEEMEREHAELIEKLENAHMEEVQAIRRLVEGELLDARADIARLLQDNESANR